jgi:hypothetical protein
VNVVDNDTLSYTPEEKYPVIVMNPPFENFQDIDHVMHAYENQLADGGQLRAIMGAGVMNTRNKAQEFRAWVEENGGYIEELPQGSFLESENKTGVSTVYVNITKPEAKAKPEVNTSDQSVEKFINSVSTLDTAEGWNHHFGTQDLTKKDFIDASTIEMREKYAKGDLSAMGYQDAIAENLLKTYPAQYEPRKKKSNTYKVYRGHGRADRGSVYAGAAIPILGDGFYFAFSESVAKEYGPNVDEVEITLKKPLIINSDHQWREITKAAGWKKMNPAGLSDAEIQSDVDALTEVIRSEGYDGVVIEWTNQADKMGWDMEEDGTPIKMIMQVFGDRQVFTFENQKQVDKPATKQTIEDSADDVAVNKDDIVSVRKWLVAKIDRDIKKAKARTENFMDDYRAEAATLAGMGTGKARDKKLSSLHDLREKVGFITYDVPGDGKFRILNFEDNLIAFKNKVEKSAGFKNQSRRVKSPAGPRSNSAGSAMTSVIEFIREGELENAYHLAQNLGKPLMFGQTNSTPMAYARAKDITLPGGIDAFVGYHPTEGWKVIEKTTGMGVSGKDSTASEKKAVKSATDLAKKHADKLAASLVEKGKANMQTKLESEFTAQWKDEGTQTVKDRETFNSATMDMAGTNYQMMWSSLGTPARVDRITINDEVVKIPKETAPIRREQIRRQVEKIIGTRIYAGKVRGKSRLGFYRRNNSEVRLKKYDDVEVLAHEMAHYLDFHKPLKHLDFRKHYKTDEVAGVSYTMESGLKHSEGFAEFVRLYLTQNDVALEKVPVFYKKFEKILQKDKKLAKQMKELQKLMHQYYHQGAFAKASGKIGYDDKSSTVEEFLDRGTTRVRERLVDKFHAAKVIERTLKGDIASAEDSMARQFQLINGAESVYDAILRYGTPKVMEDGSFDFDGKSLQEVFKPVMKKGRKEFDNLMKYFIGRRASELYQQGRENLFDAQEITEFLQLGKENPEFELVFQEFQAFNERMLNFYVDMGLITKETKKAFREANKSYVPFQRVVEQVNSAADGTGSSIHQRLTGGSMNVKDVAENIVDGLFSNVRAAMVARAKQTMYKEIMRNQDGSLFATKIPTDTHAVKTYTDELTTKVAQTMAAMGITIAAGQMIVGNPDAEIIVDTSEIKAFLEENPDMLTFFTHGHKPKTVGTMVDSAIIDGQQVYFEIQQDNEMLVNMLESLGTYQWGGGMRFAFGVKNFVTRSITSLPPFLVPNAIRDTISTTVISENLFIPVVDTLRGMFEFYRKSDLYKLAMLNGMGYGTRIEAHTEELRSRRQLDLPASNPWDAVVKGWAGYERFASGFEYGSRLGDFRRAIKAGKNPMQAAWEGREVATDFAKVGSNKEWQALIRTIPFANAGLQGMDKTARKIFELQGEMKASNLWKLDKEKAMFVAKGIPLTAATMILYALFGDDERYEELPADQKVRFWHIWVDDPAIAKALGIEETGHIKIPRPYDIGHIFGAVPEAMLDAFAKKEGKDAAKMLAFAGAQTFGVFDYPGILNPVIELGLNKKFTGAPIVPTYMDKRSGEYSYLEYNERTPMLYRKMGKAMNMSPLQIEHLVKGYTGYLEMMLVDMTDAYFWDNETMGERPVVRDTTDYFFKQFREKEVPYRTKYTEEFYDLKNLVQDASAGARQLEQEIRITKDGKELEAFLEKNALLTELKTDINDASKDVSELNEAMLIMKYQRTKPSEYGTLKEKELSADQKMSEIQQLRRQRNEIMKQQVLAFDSILKQFKQQQERIDKKRK